MSDVVVGEADKAPVTLPSIQEIIETVKPAAPETIQEAVDQVAAAVVEQTSQPIPTVEPPKPQEPDARVVRGLETLAQKERELREQREALEKLQKELEPLRVFKEKLEEDDALGALDSIGAKFEDLSKAVLAGTGTKPHKPVEERLRKEIDSVRTQLTQEVEQIKALQQERLRLEFEQEASREIASKSDLVQTMGQAGVKAVLERFQAHYSEKGEVPSYETVIREVEAELVSFLEPYFKSEAAQKRFLQVAQSNPASVTPKTLTNRDSAVVTKRSPQPEITTRDRRQAIDEILSAAKR